MKKLNWISFFSVIVFYQNCTFFDMNSYPIVEILKSNNIFSIKLDSIDQLENIVDSVVILGNNKKMNLSLNKNNSFLIPTNDSFVYISIYLKNLKTKFVNYYETEISNLPAKLRSESRRN